MSTFDDRRGTTSAGWPELTDITEVEYRTLRLERVVLIGVWTDFVRRCPGGTGAHFSPFHGHGYSPKRAAATLSFPWLSGWSRVSVS
jgi:hypothetical protein